MTDSSARFAMVHSANTPAAGDFEKRGGDDDGPDGESDLRRHEHGDTGRDEQRGGGQESKNPWGEMPQRAKGIVQLIDPKQQKFHSRANLARGQLPVVEIDFVEINSTPNIYWPV